MEILYRYCCAEEVKNFIKNGFTRSRNCEFISLTDNKESPIFDVNKPEYNYCVTFNADLIYQQGGFKVIYTEEFFKQNPIVLEHVSRYKLDPPEYIPTYVNLDHLIHQTIHNATIEQEVLVKFLTLNKDLIISIDRWDGIGWINIINNNH